MLDRLIPVGAERAGGLTELPVEVDGGVEGEVLLEPQLVFESVRPFAVVSEAEPGSAQCVYERRLITKLAPILRVPNPDAERAFYELFGLHTTYEGPEYPGFIALGNGAVEFGLSVDSDPDPGAAPGLVQWQLVVSDIDMVIGVCERARLNFDVIIEQPSAEWRYRVVKVRSPNGFDVSLEGPKEDVPAG